MSSFDTILLVAGGLLLALDVFSEALRRMWLSVPLVALVAGALLGPEVIGVIDPGDLGDAKQILEGLARAALALAVVDIALRMDPATLAGLWRTGLRLLVGGMAGMWLITGLGAWLLLDVPLWVAFLIGAILTPTDPVVAATITSEAMALAHLPARLRHLLEFESGANDGLAIVLFLLPAIVLTEPSGEAGRWLEVAGRELGIAIGGGALLGAAAGWVTNWSLRHKDVQEPMLMGVSVGLALVTLAAVHLLEGSGILAAFVGGLLFAMVLDDGARRRLDALQQAVANLLVPPAFAFFGMLLPFGDWSGLGLAGVVFALWVLLLRRPPVVAAVLAGSGEQPRDRAFLAWFGPLGVAAMYYMALVESWDVPQADTIFAAASLAVVASILAHGVSATPAVRRYGGHSATAPLRHPFTPHAREEIG